MWEKDRINIVISREDLEEINDYVSKNNEYNSRSDFFVKAGLQKIIADKNEKDLVNESMEKIKYIDKNVELLLQMLVGFMFNNEMAGMDDYYKESVIYFKAQKALDNYFKKKKMNNLNEKTSNRKREVNLDFLYNSDDL
ncbi:hypothetical protein [Nosocomiicoccus massiliensis]|uniref:Uncharacterized protein n=1 Tax=Nosocomiicoccus massiliensis TaxID=1232430 RepID=A0AAF0YL99_9STAP|nr:hypothetical protein [Nosocomiicoccus massiliensis]WOS95804.1 hypothetical protein CJ229_006825 [Nosocomiicoccus massiliensis]